MKKQTARSIIATLTKNGYKAQALTLYGVGADRQTVDGVKVDTDYNGFYPGADQFEALHDIRRRYGKKYTVQQRGHYTAIFIY